MDLSTVIIPLIKLYNLQFLTLNRVNQYSLLSYIIDNNIIHWEDVNFKNPVYVVKSEQDLIKLDYFASWVVGFIIAESSFGIKSKGSAFFSVKQKGLDNYNIIKGICLLIAEREAKPIKADAADCYQLTLSSKLGVEKVIKFFSSSDNILYGHKLLQYEQWLDALKTSNRYKNIKFP